MCITLLSALRLIFFSVITVAVSEEAKAQAKAIHQFTETLRRALHNTFRYGQGTKDMAGKTGLSTEKFIDKVSWRLGRYMAAQYDDIEGQDITVQPARSYRRNCKSSLSHLFDQHL